MLERKSINSRKNKEAITLFFMVSPCILFILFFSYSPLRGWIYSLYNYKPGINLWNCDFVGLKNFTTLFGNKVLREQMLKVLRNTLAMAGLDTLSSILPVIFAILLNEIRSNSYRRIVQTVATLPHFVSWVIMYAMVFFTFSTNGVVNNFLISLELRDQPINFLLSTNHIWLTMEGYGIWKELGWAAIVYLAAIAGIDQELYEAAMLDGANRFQRMWHVTVPGIIPTYFVLLIIGFGGLLSVGFDRFYVFQNAINKDYVEVLDLYVYNQGIASGNISYATAVGVIQSLVAILLFSFANSLSKVIRGSSIF